VSKWPLVALGDIFTIARGGSPRPIDSFITDDPNGVNWIMIGDAVEGSKYITKTKKRIRKEGVSRSREVKPGDFLLTNSMSFGHPYILATAGCIHDGWLVLSPRDNNVDQDYFYHLLGSPFVYAEFERLAAGAVVKNLNSDLVRGVKVPHPPLAEQRRIADILDKADAIRRKRREAIALTEELLRSAFLEMFGDPVTNPRGWPLSQLGAVIERLDAGWSANGEPRVREDNEYGVLKVSAVTSGVFRPEEHKAVPAHAIDRELVTPRAGDLLFSRANTRELVAATCLVERDEPHLFLPDKLWRVVPRADRTTTPYLRFLLAHNRFRAELTRTATGTSGSMLNVSMEKLRGLRGPFPPLDRQERFSRLVWKALDSKARHETAHSASDDLFNSLVSRSFTGSLEAAC
jgi:type I restriction enzyme, S subunit